MKTLMTISLCLILCVAGYAQDPDMKVLRITNITGMQGEYVVGGPVFASNFLLNWTIDNVGGRRLLKQRLGYERIGGKLSQSGTVSGLFWLTPAAADEQLVVVHAGRLYKYVLAGDTLHLKGGDSALFTSPTVGGMFSGRLVVTDGSAVQYYNGSAVTDSAYQWSVWHSSVDRQWLGGHSDADSIDLLAFTTPNEDTLAGTVRIGYNDGYGITAVSSLENYIYAHKPNGIWIVTLHTTSYTDNQDNAVYAGTPATVYKSYAKHGAMNARALVSSHDGDFYVANDGVYLFQHGNVTKLSTPIDHYFKDSIDHCRTHLITAAIHDDKFYFSYPITDCASTNGRTLVYDFETQSWYSLGIATPYFLSNPSAEEHLFASGDSESPGREKLYWADNSSAGDRRVYVYGGLTDTIRSDDGSTFTSTWQTGWWCGEEGANIKKNLLKFWLTAHTVQGSDITLNIYENFSGSATHTQEYTLSPGWNQIDGPIIESVQAEYFRFRATVSDSSGLTSLEEWDIGYTIAGEK